MLMLLTPQAMTDPTETARQLVPFAQTGRQAGPGVLDGRHRRVRGPRLLGRGRHRRPSIRPRPPSSAFLHLVQYRRNQELLYETPAALPEDWQPDASAGREPLIDAVRAEDGPC